MMSVSAEAARYPVYGVGGSNASTELMIDILNMNAEDMTAGCKAGMRVESG
jgi:hypothetical protein